METRNLRKLNSILGKISTRQEEINAVLFPILSAVEETARKFGGKVLNRRFTTAITEALSGNGHHITAGFAEEWNGKPRYSTMQFHYRSSQGDYRTFYLYASNEVHRSYSNESGRIEADRVLWTVSNERDCLQNELTTLASASEEAERFIKKFSAIEEEMQNLRLTPGLGKFIYGSYEIRI